MGKPNRFHRQPGPNAKYTVEDIKTPRNWEDIPDDMKAYFMEFECFLVLRYLLELNLKPQQVIDMIAISLMYHDKEKIYKFRDRLTIVNEKFTYTEVFNTVLVRYLWVGGHGINKIAKIAKVGQNTVYEVAYNMEAERLAGRFDTPFQEFVSPLFIANLDKMMEILNILENYKVRRDPNAKRGGKAIKQIDYIRKNLLKVKEWHV